MLKWSINCSIRVSRAAFEAVGYCGLAEIAAVIGATPANFSMPCSMAPGSVAAMAWALRMARRKAAAVFGFFFSQLAVTM